MMRVDVRNNLIIFQIFNENIRVICLCVCEREREPKLVKQRLRGEIIKETLKKNRIIQTA